jgi:hypothetical protein
VNKRVGRRKEGVYGCRQGVRVEPCFGKTEEVDFVVKNDVLKNFGFVMFMGD